MKPSVPYAREPSLPKVSEMNCVVSSPIYLYSTRMVFDTSDIFFDMLVVMLDPGLEIHIQSILPVWLAQQGGKEAARAFPRAEFSVFPSFLRLLNKLDYS